MWNNIDLIKFDFVFCYENIWVKSRDWSVRNNMSKKEKEDIKPSPLDSFTQSWKIFETILPLTTIKYNRMYMVVDLFFTL